jgi:hypothetical protein
MSDNTPAKVYNVLFVCTHNSARSIMAEGLMNTWARTTSRPGLQAANLGGTVNPFALKPPCQRLRIPTDGYRSKDWDAIRPARRTAARLRLHRLRQGRRRSVPGVARASRSPPTGACPIRPH